MLNTVMVIAVHPDDETLGCGGTLLKHKAKGDSVHWVICTDIGDEDSVYYANKENREAEIMKVGMCYNFDSIHRLRLVSLQVDKYSLVEIIDRMYPIINEIKPNIVYLPFYGDAHSDHRRLFRAAYACTKSFRYPFIKRVLMMETLSETEFAPLIGGENFKPNVFVNISVFFEKKKEIFEIYVSEIDEHPFPRSVKNMEALATFRGATAYCEYAEAFMLLKEIS